MYLWPLWKAVLALIRFYPCERSETTDIDQRSYNLHNLYPCMGLQLEVFRFFLWLNNRDLSGAYVLWSEHEDKHAWNGTIVDAFCMRLFPHVWSVKTRMPPIRAPWLTTPLHGEIYEFWDFLSISVSETENDTTRVREEWLLLFSFCSWLIH